MSDAATLLLKIGDWVLEEHPPSKHYTERFGVLFHGKCHAAFYELGPAFNWLRSILGDASESVQLKLAVFEKAYNLHYGECDTD